MPIDKKSFCSKHKLSEELFEKAGGNALCEIYDDFLNRREDYDRAAQGVGEYLRRRPQVHSIRLRAKDPEGLILKIIRKYSDKGLTKDTYRETVTDLAGIRALHLYRKDWLEIHKYIQTTWKIRENKAFIRAGDDKELYVILIF